jgi:hypothetical protein
MRRISDRVGRWTVTKLYVIKCGHKKYLCYCSCGKKAFVARFSLVNGDSKSCGCLRNETINITHGETCNGRTTEYLSWTYMINRCCNKNSDRYPYYGGKGKGGVMPRRCPVCGRFMRTRRNDLKRGYGDLCRRRWFGRLKALSHGHGASRPASQERENDIKELAHELGQMEGK